MWKFSFGLMFFARFASDCIKLWTFLRYLGTPIGKLEYRGKPTVHRQGYYRHWDLISSNCTRRFVLRFSRALARRQRIDLKVLNTLSLSPWAVRASLGRRRSLLFQLCRSTQFKDVSTFIRQARYGRVARLSIDESEMRFSCKLPN